MQYLIDRHMRHLLALADHRSVQGAAAVLGITQPALSKSLRRLENEIGALLFERTPQGLVPTEAGRRLVSHARILADVGRQAELDLSSLAGSESGALRLAAGLAWSAHRAPAALSALSQRFPRVSLELITGVGPRLLPLLATRRVDIYVGVIQPELIPDGCLVERRSNLFLRAMCRSDHPILADPDPARLGDYPWAFFAGDAPGRETVRQRLLGYGAKSPSATLVSNSIVSVFEIARTSDHLIPVIDELTQEAQVRGLTVIDGVAPLAEMPTGMVLRRSLSGLAPVRALMELLDR